MTLEERLGEENYARRKSVEDERTVEARQFLSSKFTFIKLRVLRPLEVSLLKLFGLYSAGRREFHDIEVTENEIRIPGLSPALSGFTILQMSDLHIDIDPSLVTTIRDRLAGLKYDLCVMTGDYKNMTVGDSSESVRLMTELRQAIRSDVIATLGNHDTLDIVEPLEKAGYRILLNENEKILRGGAELYIAGIDDPYIYKTHSLERALGGIETGAPVILLSHAPVLYAEAEASGVTAMLCGHTHGGQVCLPNGFPILCHERCPRRYISGSWRYGRLAGYTSRGTGGCGIAVRYYCRPELTLHRLIAE